MRLCDIWAVHVIELLYFGYFLFFVDHQLLLQNLKLIIEELLGDLDVEFWKANDVGWDQILRLQFRLGFLAHRLNFEPHLITIHVEVQGLDLLIRHDDGMQAVVHEYKSALIK